VVFIELKNISKIMGLSRIFLLLVFGLMPLFLFSGCGDLEPEMQDTRSVVLKMNFNQRSSSRSSQISQAEVSNHKTHLILALPAWEQLSSSYLNYYNKTFAEELMNPLDNKVSLEIPLNTQMKIFAFLYTDEYTPDQLLSEVREVGYYGQSQSFSIGKNTNNLSLGITLQSAGTSDGDDDGEDTTGGGDQGSVDSTAPTVTFSPVNGTADIGVSGNITITFSEAVRSIDNTELTNNNIDSLITLKLNNASGSNINFDATINTDKTVITINPTSSLPNSQVVYVAIGATVEDSAGNAITAANASFTTMALQPTVATEPPLENPGSAYNGTSNKYVVSTLGHLSYIAQHKTLWDKNFIQTADIDATVTKYWDDADDVGGVTDDIYNDSNDATSTGNNEGFNPLGNSTTKFTGEYDGKGYSISNLTINRSSNSNNTGLFGWALVTTIRNLGLTNVKIIGHNSVGPLIGLAHSTEISNCYATSGTVIGNSQVGGLVGYLYGYASITNSYSNVDNVTGSSYYIGGLAGYIENSTILNSYSTGSVVSTSYRGGLVGSLSASLAPIDSFYDKTTSGQSDTGKGTGKTTAEMKTLATFTDTTTTGLSTSWDFDTIWNIDSTSTINSGYPYLR